MITSSIAWDSTVEMRAFVRDHAYVGFTCGWGPQTVTYTPPDQYERDWAEWAQYVQANPGEFLAIGEAGLDFHHAKTLNAREKQIEEFRKVVQIALVLDKPLVLHVRNAGQNDMDPQDPSHTFNAPDAANQEILSILREYHVDPRRVVWHCFSGPPAYGPELEAQGFLMSVPSSAWGFPKWARPSAQVSVADLITETDACFQHPWKVGPYNVPANVRYAIAAIAATHGVTQEEVAEQTVQNAVLFFGLEQFICNSTP
jgi:TatD DNase family protein